MRNAVPFARGLGSSAATIAAGVLAGLTWLGDDRDPFPLAAELEGHPDNVAAALNGGIMLSWKTARGAAVGAALSLSGRVRGRDPAVRALDRAGTGGDPAAGAAVDAVHNAARAALLVAALEQGRPDLLADALDDRLHEPYRPRLVPLLGAVRERIQDLPALGATLSGAGPTVLVWAEPGTGASVAAALDGLDGARAQALAIAERGARAEIVA